MAKNRITFTDDFVLKDNKVGFGTNNPLSTVHIDGDSLVSGAVTATSFNGNINSQISNIGIATASSLNAANYYASGVTTSLGGFVGNLAGNVSGIASTAISLENTRTFEITGDVVASPVSFDGTGNVSLAATIQPNSVGLGTDTFGDYVKDISGTANEIVVTGGTGESSTPVISIAPNPTFGGNVVVENDLQINNNLNVIGNITIGGTTAIVYAQEFRVSDKDIVLGFTTDGFGNEVSTDTTANGGGVAIASTEGSPLVCLSCAGINTFSGTYKQLIWFKSGAFSGLNTDAWLSNYAIGIGSTQVPNGVRLAAGGVQLTDNDIIQVRNINSSGIITGSYFYGDGSNLDNIIATSGNVNYATNAGVATYATSSGISTYASNAGVATYASTAGIATYATSSGIATYASNAGVATYASTAGIATSSGIATYATTAGIATNIKGGDAGHIPYQTATDTTSFIDATTALPGQAILWNGSVPYWDNVSAASGYFGGITVEDGGNPVGTSGSITSLNFTGNNISVEATVGANGIATITVADYVSTAGVATALQNARTFEITGDVVSSPISFDGTGNVSLAATIQPNSVGLGTDTFGDYVKDISGTANEIYVTGGTGEGSTPVISFASNPTIGGNVTIGNDLQVANNLNVTGNITVGGTAGFILVDEFRVKDRDIILGFTTDGFGNEVSTDTTANGGGVAIASTEGSPLVCLQCAGINTFPGTYKQLIWFKSGAFSGLNTDAWLSNYAIGIGSTQVPNGVRLAAGGVQLTDNDIIQVRNINSSGIITGTLANDLTLDTSGTGLSGIATYNNSGAATFTVTSNATDANTSSTIVARDGSGNFSAGTITANLTGTATTATKLENARDFSVSGDVATSSPVSFNGNDDVDLAVTLSNDFNANTSGIITATTFVGNLTGTATTATNLSDAANITTGTIDSARLTGTYDINISGNAATATYATSSGIATYATSSGISTYATSSGIATYATSSGISTYASNAGVATSVISGIASVTQLSVSGISTFVGVGTFQSDLYVGGDLYIGDDIIFTANGVNITGIVTVGTTLDVNGDLNVSGISTLGTVEISSGIVTASSGIVTYYGDGQYLQNILYGVGVATAGGTVGTGASIIDFRGAGISTVTVASGIATINIAEGGPTVFNDTTTNQEFYLTFTDITSGTLTSTGISSTKLNFNPSTGNFSATQFTSLSDATKKTNIRPVENALDIVSDLRGVSFDWKETGKSSYGVIAQELEQVLPELVGNGEIKTVNYNGIIGVLIEAVKELKNEIQDLKSMNKNERPSN